MRLSRHDAWRAALVLCLGMIVMDNKMTLLRRHRLWLTLGWAWIAFVVYLSLSPRPPEIHMLAGDKIGHIAAYTFLMLWFVQLYQSRSVKFAIALGLVGLGIASNLLRNKPGIELLRSPTCGPTQWVWRLDCYWVEHRLQRCCVELNKGFT